MGSFSRSAGIPDVSRRALYRPGAIEPFVDLAGMPPLSVELAGDDPVLGWWLASCCHLAFHEDGAARRLLEPSPLSLEAAVDDEGCRAIVLGAESLRVVAFCGTRVDELRNLRHDADARRGGWRGPGEVHRGFLDAWQAVRDELLAALSGDDRPLMLTGYSLGAAMSQLADLELSPRVTVGFGAPRVGDAAFAASLDARPLFRYQNCCDAVGHLPPHALGFRHGGELLFLSASGELTHEPNVSWMHRHQRRAAWRYALSMPCLCRDKVLLRPLIDHAIPNYTARLRQLSESVARTQTFTYAPK